MAQQFATKLATKNPEGAALRAKVGLPFPDDNKPTIVGPSLATPAPLGAAEVGYTADDPRRKQAAMQKAIGVSTIVGSGGKLG